jgi:hypothetical protein
VDAIGVVFRQGTTVVLGTNITAYFLVDLDQVVDNIQVYGLAENDVIAIARQRSGILNTDDEYASTASWRYVGDFSASMGNASLGDMTCAGMYGDYVYLFGGGTWNVLYNQHVARYDTTNDSCSIVNSNLFSGTRYPLFGAQVGSSMYLSPGQSNEFWVYDMATETLTSRATKPHTPAIGHLFYDASAGTLTSFPGYNNVNTYAVYTIATNTWSATTPSEGAAYDNGYDSVLYLPADDANGYHIRLGRDGQNLPMLLSNTTGQRIKRPTVSLTSSSAVADIGVNLWAGASVTWGNYYVASRQVSTEATMFRFDDSTDVQWVYNFLTGQSQWVDWRYITNPASAYVPAVITQHAGTFPHPATTNAKLFFRNVAGDKWYTYRAGGSVWQLDDISKLIPYGMP